MINGQPLVIEIFAGTFGWSAGWLAMGGRAIGFDLEHLPHHGPVPEGASLVLQNALTLHGSQFKDADLLLMSPPCQRYSYMAMPFSRGKKIAAEYRSGVRDVGELNALFNCCFRLQREASEAAGWHIPMVVENVKGAQPWVGRAKAHYGSFYLYGDVEMVGDRIVIGDDWWGGRGLRACDGIKGIAPTGPAPTDGSGKSSWFFQSRADPRDMRKNEDGDFTPHGLKRPGRSISAGFNNWPKDENGAYVLPDGTKVGGSGAAVEPSGPAALSSRSLARKAASAQIARIPYALSAYVAQAYWPKDASKYEPEAQLA